MVKAQTRNVTFTTVPVKPETLRRLRSYKVGGKTYDDVLNDFMDETPTARFIAWHLGQVKDAQRIPWNEKSGRFGR
ncbi:MAG: hypothetical protein AABY18_04035 [Candidatus Thermoplasmatota archaeon]